MQNSYVLQHVSRGDCDLALSFEGTLGDLLAESAMSQTVLEFRRESVGLNWMGNKVSRLINNDLPNNL